MVLDHGSVIVGLNTEEVRVHFSENVVLLALSVIFRIFGLSFGVIIQFTKSSYELTRVLSEKHQK